MRGHFRKTVLCIGGIIFVIPILLTLIFSFVNNGVDFEQWNELLFNCFVFYKAFWNSCIYSILITFFHMLLVIPCAFGLYELNGKCSKVVIYICIVLAMMPLQVTILPNYIGLRNLNLLNTRRAIILPMIFSTFGVVVMYQYLKEIDWEQIEAARMETSSMIRILCRIVIPNVKTAIGAIAVFIFIESYNMLEQPLLFLDDQSKQNLTVMLSRTSDFNAQVFLPMAVVFMIPPVLGCFYTVAKSSGNIKLTNGIKGASIVFFSTMLLLTVLARDIHNSRLVKVKTIEPELKIFQIDENIVGKYYAMPYQFSNFGTYYVTENQTINGEERTCLRQIYIKLGKVKKGYCPILNREYSGEPIVVRVTGKIHDMDEVIEIK